ncbi:MAG: FlgD immunoglobulin-like domain containing protein [Polyangiaceae bacterium]
MELDGVRTQAPPSSALGTQTGTVDKEAFLQLLVAQLKNQDPLSPVDGTEWVAQLATFSEVEQSLAQTEQLNLLSVQLTGIASNEAIGLIGKSVTVRGDTIAFDGKDATGFNVNLSEAAEEVTVTIRDEHGQAVRTIELGSKPGGTLEVPWDGTDDNGNPVPAGQYKVEVAARDESGSPVTVSQDVTGEVVGVSFEKGYPEVELDTGAKAPISDLIRVDSLPVPPSP